MAAKRETRVRGTPDFPFARYRQVNKEPGVFHTKAHYHPDIEIIYVHRGDVGLLTDQTEVLLQTGDIAFISPNALHSLKSYSREADYQAMVFSTELIAFPGTHFFQQTFLQPLQDGKLALPVRISADDAQTVPIRNAVKGICDADPQSPDYKMTVLSLLFQTCSAIKPYLQTAREGAVAKGNETVKACVTYLENNYSEKITLEMIADHVHLHPNYLCALFKNYTGQSIFQHLIQLRIENAARLLRKEHVSISEAALRCGFESIGFFTRKFKSYMGVTPKAYAKHYL